MQLIVFVGVSSLGALFLIVFFAKLCRDDRGQANGSLSGVSTWWRDDKSVRRAPSTIPLVLARDPRREKSSDVVALRRTVHYSEPQRSTQIPGQQKQAQVR